MDDEYQDDYKDSLNIFSWDLSDPDYIFKPIPKGLTLYLQVKRDNSGFKRFAPKFYLYEKTKNQYLIFYLT